MTNEKLAAVTTLRDKLMRTRTELSKILQKVKPQAKGAEASKILDILPDGKNHTLHIEFNSGSLQVNVPPDIADKFLSDLERHYDREQRALEQEFERA